MRGQDREGPGIQKGCRQHQTAQHDHTCVRGTGSPAGLFTRPEVSRPTHPNNRSARIYFPSTALGRCSENAHELDLSKKSADDRRKDGPRCHREKGHHRGAELTSGPRLTIHLTPHLEGRVGRRGEQEWKLLLPSRSAPTTGRHSGHDVAGCEIVHNGRSSWTLMAVDMSTLPPKAGRTADSHTSHMTAMTMTSSTCIPSSDPTTTCHTGCQEQPTSQMQEAAQSLAHFSHCWAGAEPRPRPEHPPALLRGRGGPDSLPETPASPAAAQTRWSRSLTYTYSQLLATEVFVNTVNAQKVHHQHFSPNP